MEISLPELAAQVFKALGGKENVVTIEACTTRLRVGLKDRGFVDDQRLKDLGAMGLIEVQGKLHVIFGFLAPLLKEQLTGSNSLVQEPQYFGAVEMVRPTTFDFMIPMDGILLDLKAVPDDIFSSGMMGPGIAFDPQDGLVIAPFEGIITMLFPTLHGLSLLTKEGLEVLIHLGIDTVDLQGEGFQALVRENEVVKQGQPLLQMDLEYIQKNGRSVVSPIIFTNLSPEVNLVYPKDIQVKRGETGIISLT